MDKSKLNSSYFIFKKDYMTLPQIAHQSSQLHRNWKLLKWWENQLMNLQEEIEKLGYFVSLFDLSKQISFINEILGGSYLL